MHHYINLLLLLSPIHNVTPFVTNVSIKSNNACRTVFNYHHRSCNIPKRNHIQMSSTTSKEQQEATPPTTKSFIDTALRSAAMKLHTKKQAPKEGEAEVKVEPKEPHITTHDDYLRFLVDSQHVYSTLEEIVNSKTELSQLRNSGLERKEALEDDIQFMVKEYNLVRPEIGQWGTEYAQLLLAESQNNVPKFVCHYYNHYFAHTAGGRMIGKKMSAMLLNKKTLEFYKWDGDINEIKVNVKEILETLISKFTSKEKEDCIDATADTFRFGGGLMSYLAGGRSMGY